MCGECNWPLKLGDEEMNAFIETLKNPPPLNDKFKQAFQEYNERKMNDG